MPLSTNAETNKSAEEILKAAHGAFGDHPGLRPRTFGPQLATPSTSH